ncbi:unnamed protein product [Lota lota]
MSSQRSRKVRMGSSRRHLARNALLADDVVPETQTDPDSTDSVNLDYSEHGNRLDLKEPISEILHETSEDIANASEKCGSLIRPPSALEIGVRSNRSPGVSQQPPEPQKEDMPGNNRTENLGMSESNELIEEQCREFSENKAVSQMGMLPDDSCQKTTPQRSTPANDNRTPEVSQCSGDDWHPRHNSSLYSSPAQPFADDMSNCPKQLSDSIIHKGEHEIDFRKENTNSLAVSFSPGTKAETREYLFQIEGICGDVQSSVKKEHEVKDYVNPLLTQFEHPIQSVVCPLLIEVPNQEEAEQEQITNTTPESHDTTGNYGVVVESQHLTIQDTFNPGNNQEMTVQDDLENTKRDHIFDLSDLEHNMKENTCSQVCESEGQASNKPWEFIEDSAQEEGEGHSLNIGPLQSECSSASADDENDHTRLTRGGNISFNDGTVENLTKQPVTDAEFMEPEKNQSASEKTVNLDSTIEFKDGCNNDCNITTSTEFNPQSEDVVPTSSNVTLSDSHSVDVLLVESCPSTNMADVNPLATVPQHCTSSGEDQCKSKEMYAPTSSQLRDGSAQVGAQTSTGLSHSLGITEIDLNKSYLENKNKNPVEMPEVETDFPQNSEGAATDCSRLDKDVKLTELASNQEQDGDLDIKSSRKKRKNGSSRRIGNKGIRGGVDHSGEIVESDFSTDPNKTNKSFEAELKVEMKCNSELPEGGMLGTFTDKADCLFLIPPQSEEIKERGSEDIIDKARKEEYTGANIHLPPEGSHGDVDDRKEDEAEEKSEIVEKMEVIKMPLFKTMSERNIQEISEEMSRQHHEEEVCRASTGPQEKDIRPPGAVFDLSDLEHNMKENTCSQVCESEGQASNEPWEFIKDSAQEEGEGHSLNIGPLQSECSSASADDEKDHTCLTRGGNISFNDGTVENLTKQPVTDAEFMEPEKNQSASEKTVNLDSTIEFKDGCNNDSNITPSTEMNPQSEDVVPTSSNVTLSDSHSVDVLLVESCPSTNMADVNPLATVPQHCTSSGEDQCKSKEMYAPTSSQLRDGSAQVGAQTSTGLSHSLGITEIDLNKSYLENENKNPVEMPEVETDFPQNSEGAATDCSRLDKDVKLTELASNQEQDGDLDIKSSRKKRKNGSSRRIGNKGIRGGVDHSGEIVESDFSTDPNKTNKSFEAELKVEMKCNSELPEGGMLGTFTDKADCLFLIPPQSEEIKERGSEDIIDKARKEEYTGANIHLPPEGSHGDVDDRKEDEAEEKSEIVEKMEVIKMPLFKTMSERNIQEISEEMSRQHHEEEVCRASTGPQEKDIRPPGAVFDLSDLEHNMKENTCSQVCESEGQASNEPWEFIKDSAQEEGEGHSLNIGPLQSECSSASADDEKDHTCLTRGGNISFNDGTVENLTKQPVTDAEFMEPEKNQSASEKTVNLDSTIEFKDGCNNDSNITPSTEMNPQSEDVVPTSSNVTLSDSHSVDVLLVESCPSTNMADVNPLATVPQHCTSSGEDQCKSKEMYAPTSSQLRDGSAQVGAQTSTGLSHSLGITEIDLNKSYLENENKNPVEMPEVETDFPQNSEGAATDCSRLDKDVKLTELASNQEQDGDLDIKSSRKKRKNGSSRRIGNKGIRGGVDHSGEIVESDFSTDPNKTNKSFEAELKVEMKCNSELPEGGMLGTFTDKADCLFLIPPQSEEIKERGSEDIIDKARKEEYTGANIHLPPEGSHGDVDDRKEDEAEEKSEIVEKMEVIKMPLFKTMSERNIQEISEEMSRQHHEEEVCRASTGPQEKDIRPPEKNQSASEKTVNLDSTIEFKDGCNNDSNITPSTEMNPQSEDVVPTSSNVTLSDSHSVDVLLVESCPSTNMADVNPLATVPQHCTSSGEDQCKSKEMYAPTSSQLRDGSAQVGAQTSTGLSHSLGITEIDLNKSYLENENKNPVEMPEVETDFPQNSEGAATDCSRLDKDVKLTELASNQEQDGDLDIKSSRKKRKNGSSRRIGNKGIRGGVDHSGEIVESDFSTDPNKTNKSFEAELKVEMKWLSHSLGITEIDLNKSYLENENKNPVEMPEVEKDFPQNSEGAATDCSRLDKDVKLTELASNQEQDGELDIKSSRKKRKIGSSRRIGNKGIRGGVDHSGEIVESDFSTDPNKTNKSFEAELKVEMKCNSELPEGGMLGTFTDKADCLFLIPPQSEEIKERGSEDIIDKARKEEYTGANIHLPPEGSHGDVDDRKEDEAEEKSEIVEKMEVIKMPLFKTMSERNIQEISEEMSRQHHEEEVEGAATDCSRLDKDVKLTELASNQEQVGDLDIKSSRKKRKIGSSRRIGNKGIRGGVDHSGEIVESDFSTDPNKTNKSFEAELKVEMKCNSELPEGGMLGTFTDKADCLFLIPPQSEEIKERGSEDIIDKARKEEYTGANIHLPPEGSHGDVDDRKEEEAEEKSEIVEKMEVTKMPLFKTMSERNIQEISEEMSRQHHEEEVCRASTGPQEKDIRPPGADFPMLAQSSLSKENTPHSEDMNSSILFAPVSGIRDTDGKMDTAGQHPTAHSSNLDQISGQGNQHSLPNVKDDDKQVLRRRKMGSSRWTKGTATGSQKGSKEAQTTADQEIEKHAVISENISEEDLPKQIFKDNEGAEKVVTEDKEPSPIGGDAHQSMSETNISATQTINGERSSETDVKRVNTTLSGLPSELSNDLHVEGRRRKLGSQRKSRGQQHHDYPPESEDQRALNFGDHPPTPPSLRQVSSCYIALYNEPCPFSADPSSKCDLRADCFNVVMVGSSNVGKTSFMKRVQSGSFSPHFSASIGIDTCIHALPVDGSEVRLQLWDTAGQERFRSISKQVFHKGQAFLLMYDITSSKSFSDVRYWIGCIQESAGKDVIILLLGNKSDCAGRQVNPSEGQRLAKEYNIDFNECSAATGEHIISSIESLARKLTENDHTIEEGLVLQKQTKNRRCC